MSQAIQTFNHKALMRIAIVMAFIQFTNALEYMMFNPIFAFMAAETLPFPYPSQVMCPVYIHWGQSFRALSLFTGLVVSIRSVF
jgi:hypothetical protein